MHGCDQGSASSHHTETTGMRTLSHFVIAAFTSEALRSLSIRAKSMLTEVKANVSINAAVPVFFRYHYSMLEGIGGQLLRDEEAPSSSSSSS